MGVLLILELAAAGAHLSAGQRERFAPGTDLGLGHFQAAAQALLLVVITRDIGSDAQLHQRQVRLGCLRACHGRGGQALQTPEHVDLPLHIKAGAIGLRQHPLRWPTVERQLLLQAAAIGGTSGDAGILVEPAVIEHRTGGQQVGLGLANVMVMRQRRVDQAIELGVVKKRPPLGLHRRLPGKQILLRGDQADRRGYGLFVMRPDHAAVEQRQRQQDCDSFAGLHGSLLRVCARDWARGVAAARECLRASRV